MTFIEDPDREQAPPALPTQFSVSDLDAAPALLDALVQLNNDHAIELSWADTARIRYLTEHAFVATRIGLADALLVAYDQNAAYDGINFAWFRARFDRFIYVDRIVIAAAARGRGLAQSLYADLIARTRAAGHVRIVCEINTDPPNPASQAFHRKQGFVVVGKATLPDGKTVEYQELRLAD